MNEMREEHKREAATSAATIKDMMSEWEAYRTEQAARLRALEEGYEKRLAAFAESQNAAQAKLHDDRQQVSIAIVG